MTNNAEPLDTLEATVAALEAKLTAANAALTEALDAVTTRVAFLEGYSPQYRDAKKLADQTAAVAAVRNTATIDQWKALTGKQRDAFGQRATHEQVLGMLRDADRDDRKLVLASLARPDTIASVTFALAPAPLLTEVRASSGVVTRDVVLDGEGLAAELKELGLQVSRTEKAREWKLDALAMDRGDVVVFDREAWNARVEHDAMAARFVVDGKVQVRQLTDDQAREHALKVYRDGVIRARDWADSRIAPTLPEI